MMWTALLPLIITADERSIEAAWRPQHTIAVPMDSRAAARLEQVKR
jgi:hypothetical protein